jgi:2-amino-4-hydroxy-6-hydroxymethyldihydropteridine diphosphokinase
VAKGHGVVTAWIGLGSNIGDRIHLISEAVQALSTIEKTKLVKLSSLFETAPVGVDGGPFVNAVARIQTGLTARELLKNILALEKTMGRERLSGKVEPRIIDMDLLLYGEETTVDPELILPHPRMTGRRFVMEPLAELDPEIIIPETGRTAAWIARELERSHPDQSIERLGTLEELHSMLAGSALDQSSPETL